MKKILLMLLVASLLLSNFVVAFATDVKAFSDVPVGEWYYNYVVEMTEKGVIGGYPDGTFKPATPVKRDEAIKLIVVAYVEDVGNAQEYWAENYISNAMTNGMIDKTEITPDYFTQYMTREEVADLYARALKWNGKSYTEAQKNAQKSKIKDIDQIDAKYLDNVLFIYAAGVMIGDNLGNFNPKNEVKRSEITKVIAESIRLYDESTEGTGGDGDWEPITPDPGVWEDVSVYDSRPDAITDGYTNDYYAGEYPALEWDKNEIWHSHEGSRPSYYKGYYDRTVEWTGSNNKTSGRIGVTEWGNFGFKVNGVIVPKPANASKYEGKIEDIGVAVTQACTMFRIPDPQKVSESEVYDWLVKNDAILFKYIKNDQGLCIAVRSLRQYVAKYIIVNSLDETDAMSHSYDLYYNYTSNQLITF